MIKVLDQNTINEIAAGEVIEKPSSVIKELVENAIDSGATAVTVEVKGSGLSFMRVTDNGQGIQKNEVKLAFLRHATSKLVTALDLLSISSLGFRGEALASIAAVSQVELISKTADDVTGIRYQIHGGREISSEEIGCPQGTTVIVRNIFYNTPARKKFLKTDATETGYIYDLMCRISMSHPEVSFKLIVNGTDKLFTSGNGKLRDIIYHIYGRDITSNLLEINTENDFMKMSGYIARPCISRGNRSFEGYYVNHRYIKSNVLTKAIEDAFRTFVMIHKFPFTEIYFDVKPELIDVNVHPTKMELKFSNEQDVYSFTYKSVRETLLFKELIPEVSPGKEQRPETFRQRDVGKNPEAFENVRRSELTGVRPQGSTKAQSEGGSQDGSNQVQSTGESQWSSGQVQSDGESRQGSNRTQIAGILQTPDTDKLQSGGTQQVKPSADTADIAAVSGPASSQTKQTGSAPRDSAALRQVVEVIDMTAGKAGDAPYEGHDKTYSYTRSESAPKTAQEEADYVSESSSDYDAHARYVQQDMFTEKFLTKEARAKHRLIGQLFKTYWLIEYDGKFFIMDQHAAHEKVKYEELMENYKNKKIYPQYLMPPAVVTLSATETEFLRDNMEMFESLGYQIENFGGREYKLTAVPANLFGLDGRELFIDFIAEASECKNVTIDVFIHKLSTMACKAALKGNTEISFKEADALIDQLLKLENPYTCPHGRPTVISMTETEIEKKFKRIQD